MAGTAIRYYREKVRLSQVELAKKLDVSATDMSRIETGVLIPTAQQIDKLATLLEATPAHLFSKHILAEVAERSRAAS